MKEKAVRPHLRNGRWGGNRVQVSREETTGGSGTPLHAAVSQRNDITFLVANEENVLDGLPLAEGFKNFFPTAY